ncbi:MAG: Ldh family oxidoreductase [Bifidobacterium psychraerophilum]|uniref:Ldh family oxidoreductase n=1 Tax=Bifidobacterium psychraerophilum TaxID=218140 RepID=UPI0039ED7EEA
MALASISTVSASIGDAILARHPRARIADVDRAVEVIASAHLLGLHAFGIDMLLRDIDGLGGTGAMERGTSGIPEKTDAETEDPTIIEAAGTIGFLAGAMAIRHAEHNAQASGIGMIGIRNVGALGVLGSYVRQLAQDGYLGIMIANSPAIVAPYNGLRAAIGTNPVAYAAPREDGRPLVVDFATSAISMNELREHQRSQTVLPPDSAIDRDGHPTRLADDAAALRAKDMTASLIGLQVEIFSSALLGWRHGDSGRSASLLAIDPRRYGSKTEELSESIEDICASWTKAGGHVPSRYDALSSTDPTSVIDIPDASLAALERLRIERKRDE